MAGARKARDRQSRGASRMGVDYASIVHHYRQEFLPEDQAWFEYYKQLTLSRAIEKAALARGPSDEKFSHQWRIPNAVLNEAKNALLSQQEAIATCGSFDELHKLVEETAGAIPGFGELAAYDTSIRIGAHLDLWPDKIYLHAGTKIGYQALGGNPNAKLAPREEMPPELQVLEPHQIEDVLCIYKAELQGKIASDDARFYQPRKKRKVC